MFRKPINVVLGAPIPVKQNDNPTIEEIGELHATYVKELRNLFEVNKEKYGVPATSQLVIQ